MIRDFFSVDGPLARAMPGFSPRPSQLLMAEAVARAIEQASTLLVEAGTGTGKTYAYLVPALASGKRVIISTGSKALQEQLYNRDLPRLLSAMAYSQPVALLKGRANYLCHYRLDQLLAEARDQSAEVLADLARVKQFAIVSQSGDLGELTGLKEQAPILPLITSTNDNCLGRECPRYEACFLVKARRRAMEAQLLVVNHHLFFADLVVKDTGFAELMPEAELYVFDEAHQLPDIASDYFGERLASRQLVELADEMKAAYRAEAPDMAQLGRSAEALQLACRDCRLAFGLEGGRGNLRHWLADPQAQRLLGRLKDGVQLAYEVLKLALGRGERLDHCFERMLEYQGRLNRLTEVDTLGAAYWYDTSKLHFSFNRTPLSVADRFAQEVMRPGSSWVFTSATLTVNHVFDHFRQQLGLDQAEALMLDSPFDYGRQSLLCVPRGLPDTGYAKRGTLLAERLWPVINQVPGGIFFLCTSYQSLHQVAEVLRRELGRTVLVQGEDSKQGLLQRFVENGRAVLVATSAFWEGVDVQGAALSCVIIDKLPFASPDDPLLKARSEDCRLQGRDPFAELQLPEAVIALKQGVGRLIRDGQDKGVLILCDPRLVQRPYGQVFLGSLPPMPRSRELQRIDDFWQANRDNACSLSQ